jgi:hypothetical protein
MTKPADSVFSSTRLLVGLSRVGASSYLNQRDLDDGLSVDRLRRILRTFVQNAYVYHRQYIYDVLAHQYTDWERTVADPSSRREWLLELLGDGLYIAPGVELAQRHSAITGLGSTFVCSFNYVGRTSPAAAVAANGVDASPAGGGQQRWTSGGGINVPTLHSEDLAYVFGAPLSEGLDPFSSTGWTRADRAFSETIIRYWTNFIKTGNPNDPRSRPKNRGSGDIEWPAYDLDGQQLMQFGSRSAISHHYRGSKMALWLELIPKLHKSDNLDPRYHQLDDWTNQTTFEANVTRLTTLLDLLSTTQETSTATIPLPTSSHPPSTSTTVATSPTAGAGSSNRRRPPQQHQSSTQSPVDHNNSPIAVVQAATSSTSSVASSPPPPTDANTVSLSVTVAVGSFLLFLNILIFVAVYYQKDRIRRERKRRKSELASIHQDAVDRQMQQMDGYNGGVDVKTNSDSLAYHVYGGGGTGGSTGGSPSSGPIGLTSIMPPPPPPGGVGPNHHYHHQHHPSDAPYQPPHHHQNHNSCISSNNVGAQNHGCVSSTFPRLTAPAAPSRVATASAAASGGGDVPASSSFGTASRTGGATAGRAGIRCWSQPFDQQQGGFGGGGGQYNSSARNNGQAKFGGGPHTATAAAMMMTSPPTATTIVDDVAADNDDDDDDGEEGDETKGIREASSRDLQQENSRNPSTIV